jgi:hypothetical protein
MSVQDGVAQTKCIAIAQWLRLGDTPPVEEGTIGAAQILNHEGTVLPGNRGMVPGNLAI